MMYVCSAKPEKTAARMWVSTQVDNEFSIEKKVSLPCDGQAEFIISIFVWKEICGVLDRWGQRCS
jgi:hypothetical protein